MHRFEACAGLRQVRDGGIGIAHQCTDLNEDSPLLTSNGLPAPRAATGVAPPPTLWEPRLAPPSDEADAATDWRRVLSALRRHRWLVFLVTLLGTGMGLGATRFLGPVYLAQAKLWIDIDERRGTGSNRGPIRSEQVLQSVSWVDLLESYVVLEAVVRDQRLYLVPRSREDSAALTGFSVADEYRPGRYRLEMDATGTRYVLSARDGTQLEAGAMGNPITAPLGIVWVPRAPPGTRIEFTLLPLRDAARELAKDLQARHQGNFLELELRGTDPALIAGILNAVSQRFVQVAADLQRNEVSELTRLLQEQLTAARQSLAQADAALQQFRVQTITLPSERAARPSVGEMAARDPAFEGFFDLQAERDELRRNRAALVRIAAGADSGVSAEALGSIAAVKESPELSAALEELGRKQADLRALRYRYADAYPPVRQLTDEIATLGRRVIPALAGELAAELARREAELDQRMASAAQGLRGIPARELDEARLRREVELAATLAISLEQRYEEARLAEASTIPDIRILDPAVVPGEPVRNTAPRVILLAFCASLAFAGVGAVLLDRFDPRVRYPEQVSRGLGLPILGAVPHVKRNGGGEGILAEQAVEVVEALRGVRMSLLHLAGPSRPMMFTVTSPGGGDGKSFVSANLALAFAGAGDRTLLIDGDVRRGAQHRRFGVPRRPGLSDFLAEEARLDEIVRRTRFPSLSFIACGARSSDAPELLGSRHMESLLREVGANVDVIICDAPPLAAGVDPFVLGTITGQLLLVLRAGVSDREMMQAKLDVLTRLPVRVLGAVLNDVPAGTASGYYAYSYYLPGYAAEDERRDVETAGPRLI